MLELTERKKQILIAIVEAYTENNRLEPIGSTELLKILGSNVSTATLRNEMADLEEMGYLEKTHTSSGRIPTEKGYRLYVDELVSIDNIVEDFENYVNYCVENSNLPKKNQAIEKILADLLNREQVNYSALMLEKTAYNAKVRKIDFVNIRNSQAIFLLITDKGHIFHNEVSIPSALNITNIEKTVEYFNEVFKGVLLNDIQTAKGFKITDNFFDYIPQAQAIVEYVLFNIKKLFEDKKQIINPYNILNHSDFSDINFAQSYLNKIKSNEIYQLIDFDGGPIPVLGNKNGISISVKIGNEHHNEIFNNFASITAYYSSTEGTGAITVYGPMRMKYKSVIAMLIAIAKNLNNVTTK